MHGGSEVVAKACVHGVAGVHGSVGSRAGRAGDVGRRQPRRIQAQRHVVADGQRRATAWRAPPRPLHARCVRRASPCAAGRRRRSPGRALRGAWTALRCRAAASEGGGGSAAPWAAGLRPSAAPQRRPSGCRPRWRPPAAGLPGPLPARRVAGPAARAVLGCRGSAPPARQAAAAAAPAAALQAEATAPAAPRAGAATPRRPAAQEGPAERSCQLPGQRALAAPPAGGTRALCCTQRMRGGGSRV